MATLFVLVCMVVAWWLAWRTTAKIAKRKSWSTWRLISACTAVALLAIFSVFCIAGGLLLPDPANTDSAVAIAGVLILAPLTIALWRASTPRPQSRTVNTVVQLEKSILSSDDSIFNAISLPREFLLTYVDHEGRTSRRNVRVMGIASNDGRHYLDGYCLDRNAMRTFRVDRIQGDLIDMETGELVTVWSLLAQTEKRRAMTYKPNAPDARPEAAASTSREWQTAVLFTGFSQSRREELEDMALAAGWDVRSNVGPSLDYLVVGPKAGPEKVAKAEALGVTVIDKDVFQVLTA